MHMSRLGQLVGVVSISQHESLSTLTDLETLLLGPIFKGQSYNWRHATRVD